jgi:hypothetical protein
MSRTVPDGPGRRFFLFADGPDTVFSSLLSLQAVGTKSYSKHKALVKKLPKSTNRLGKLCLPALVRKALTKRQLDVVVMNFKMLKVGRATCAHYFESVNNNS